MNCYRFSVIAKTVIAKKLSHFSSICKWYSVMFEPYIPYIYSFCESITNKARIDFLKNVKSHKFTRLMTKKVKIKLPYHLLGEV